MARKKKADPISAIFQPKHPYLPGTEILRQIDVDRLAAELDVDKQGKLDGETSIPPADGATLALKEREILGRIREIWDETILGARRAYDAYCGRYASLTAETDIDALLAEPAAIAVQLREAAKNDRARLSAEYERVVRSRNSLERFRIAEGLSHEPRRGENLWTKVAFLSVAALVELVVNAAIFAGGDEFGILGAILKVLVIPIANIGGCWALTHFLGRYILVNRPPVKLAGLVGCLLTGTWLLGLNLAVAHWREAAESAVNLGAAEMALTTALADPLGLHSFESWGLFLVGCFAGVIAIWEGWNWTEPYPGYGQRYAAAEAAKTEWFHQRDEALERLEGIRSDSCARFTDAQRRAELAISERPKIAGAVISLAQDVELFGGHLRYVAEELTERYREANSRVRKGERPPQFAKPLALNFSAPEFPPLVADRQRAVAGKLSAAIQKVTDAFAQACEQIPSPSDLEATQSDDASAR